MMDKFMFKKWVFSGILFFFCPFASAEIITVFVSIPPQAYLVERIGRNLVDVHVMVEPGQNPHTFEPSVRQMISLGSARLYFTAGLPFERTIMKKITSTQTNMKVVDSIEGIQRHHGEAPDAHDHESGCTHEDHEGPDPHVWMSPPAAMVMARNIMKALQEIDPEQSAQYKLNFETLQRDIQTVHDDLQESLKNFKGRSFYVFHPAFGYFGETYNLRQVAVEVEGKSPSPKQILDLIERARADNVRIIFVQPQFDSRSAESIAKAIDGVVVSLDPMARDLLQNYRLIASKLLAALT